MKRRSLIKVLRAYEPGMTIKEIAVAAGVSYPTAYKIVKEHNLPYKKERRDYDDARKYWLSLCEPGMSANDLAKKAGVTRGAAWKAIRRYNLPIGRERPRKIADEEWLNAFVDGMTAKELAEKVGAHINTVRKAAKRLGLTLKDSRGGSKGRRQGNYTAKKVHEMLEAGYPVSAITEKLNISKQRVYQIIKEQGLTLPSKK